MRKARKISANFLIGEEESAQGKFGPTVRLYKMLVLALLVLGSRARAVGVIASAQNKREFFIWAERIVAG